MDRVRMQLPLTRHYWVTATIRTYLAISLFTIKDSLISNRIKNSFTQATNLCIKNHPVQWKTNTLKD